MTSPVDPASADPGLSPDLQAGGNPQLPNMAGQGDPAPPASPTASENAAALLDQVYRESYDRNGDDPVDGTVDPFRS